MGSEIIIILGNVGRDAEMRYTPDGKAVCNFSVAVNRGDVTNWYNVSAWERLAELCSQYVRKGMTVQVTGTPRARAYIGRDGQATASLEITARDVQFASRAEAGSGATGASAAGESAQYDEPVTNNGDIPF